MLKSDQAVSFALHPWSLFLKLCTSFRMARKDGQDNANSPSGVEGKHELSPQDWSSIKER